MLQNSKADFFCRNYCGKCSDSFNGVLQIQLRIQREVGIYHQREGQEYSVVGRTLSWCD